MVQVASDRQYRDVAVLLIACFALRIGVFLMEKPVFAFRATRRFSIAFALVVAACGGGGDTTLPGTGDYAVTLSSSSLAITAGNTGSVTATISRTGGFTPNVDLSVESLPAGVTASFSPASITTATTQTTLSVSVAPTVASGSYTFTIRAKAAGLPDRTSTASLTVSAAPSIALSLSATATTIPRGSVTQFTATVTRTNYSGATNVTVTGASNGVSVIVSSFGDVSGVAIGALVATPGTYPLVVTATGNGVASVSQAFTLTITPSPASLFTLGITPSALSVQQGNTGQVAVTISRTNFPFAVDLTLEGAPAGVTSAFGQSSVTTNSTSLTLSVGGTVAPGTYTLVVRGTATGVATQTATLSLTVTPAPAGSISLSLSGPLPTIQQGSSAGVTVVATRSGFAGTISLGTSGLPAGVTATFTPSTTTSDQWLLSFSVGVTALAGSYGVTITGSGVGIPNATVMGTLTITGTPAIALSLSPALDSVAVGGGRTFTATLTRTNYTGAVSIAISGAPSGVTTSVTGSPTTTTSATVNISVSLSTALGAYPLTVTASGAGVAPVSATYTLKVQQAPITSGNVSWNFAGCQASDRPIWMAAQNGNGVWQQVSGSNSVFAFNISGAGAVAYVTQNGANDYTVTFVYGIVGELQGRGATPCTIPTGKIVTGSVAGVNPAGGLAMVSLGATGAQIVAPASTFTLNDVASGTLDLVAARQSRSLSAPFAFDTDKLIVRRAQNLANGATIPVLDFASAEAFGADTKPVAINGAGSGETVTILNTLLTANGGYALLGQTAISGSTGTYSALPSAQLISGDLHVLTAGATQASGSSVASRSVTQVFRDPTSKVLNLGAALATPTFTTLTSSPYLRTRMQLPAQADYNRNFTLFYRQSATGTKRNVSVFNTSSYLSGAPFEFAFPDFTTVSGWQNIWGPLANTSLGYGISASGWTLGNTGYATPYIEGTLILNATQTGSVVP